MFGNITFQYVCKRRKSIGTSAISGTPKILQSKQNFAPKKYFNNDNKLIADEMLNCVYQYVTKNKIYVLIAQNSPLFCPKIFVTPGLGPSLVTAPVVGSELNFLFILSAKLLRRICCLHYLAENVCFSHFMDIATKSRR
jgi:hypothetical protein